jgi:MoaA/NifB/PqqE/SkfB family radical SAM enzyme
MDKIRIVNWILTRKCNLDCHYCAIVKDYPNKPDEYPDMKHYHSNQMTHDDVIRFLEKIKNHNPDCFHIFYGGEPLLFKGLEHILNYCYDEDIHYTVITNGTEVIQPKLDSLVSSVEGGLKGLTSSIDPVFNKKDTSDRIQKSIQGFKNLHRFRHEINDLVAEITVMRDNVPQIYDLVKALSDYGINSDITFVDIAKNPHYDFSNITDESLLVRQSPELADQFQKLYDDKSLNIHMKDYLLQAIWGILPSDMDCGIEKDVHNISIDADGSVRLCLRIRGVSTPDHVDASNLFDENFNVSPFTKICLGNDKKRFCELCNHTCMLMSMYDNIDELAHLDIRGK